MAKVIPIGTVTKLDIPVDKVLESAKGQLTGCLLMGFNNEGEFYASSSYADGGTILWLIEACKKKLMESLP